MYLIVLIAAALVTLFATPLARHAALRLGVVDRPGARKVHMTPMPLLGGLALAAGFAAGCVLGFGLDGERIIGSPLMGLAAGAFLILLLGVYDDRFGADAKLKLSVQTLAAILVVASGSRIAILTNPLGGHWHLGVLAVPISILWIVGITNAMNLIDGLDGLATGIGAIVSLTLLAIAIPDPVTFIPITAAALAGACLGFLRFNFPPARIFLGDTGSLLLGFLIAVIGMQGFLKGATALALLVPLLAVGLPVIDTALAILRRSARRTHLFRADREHLHHRLVRIGLSQRQAVAVMYWVSVFLALTALTLRDLPPQKGILLLVVAFMGGALLLKALGYVERRFRVIHDRLTLLAEAGETPGNAELSLLDGFHRQDGEGPAIAAATETAEAGEAAEPAGVPELLGRPGLARRILESKLSQRPKSP
ncbi:MAG: glycosyltransferase family 4 protein [Myxococcota bacterium]